MEKNKYYTPELEEFHVGLNYQYKWKSIIDPDPKNADIFSRRFGTKIEEIEDWIDAEVHDCTMSITQCKLDRSKHYFYEKIKPYLRIKYLDKQDIESLGWKVEEEQKDWINFKMENIDKSELLFWKESRHCELDTTEDHDLCYRGTIKNKSELKKLMKMLNIETND